MVLVVAFVTLYSLDFGALAGAQTVINGQIFTNGLAIVVAPAIGTTLHAGSDLNLAIDISGNGKLANWQAASTPGSSHSTRYDLLEAYLISKDTRTNLTVSTGPGLLNQEQGSTVKHFNWPIPNCITAGSYNLTIYESSHIDSHSYFSITPLQLSIENANPSGPCADSVNPLQEQPQASSPPASNLWTGGSTPSSIAQSSSGFLTVKPSSGYSIPTGIITVTLGPSGLIWPPGIAPYTSTSPSSAPPGGTVTVTLNPIVETVTVVVMSPDVIQSTITEDGRTVTVTTTVMSPSTVTPIISDRFLPVNSGNKRLPKTLFVWLVVFWNCLIGLVWISL